MVGEVVAPRYRQTTVLSVGDIGTQEEEVNEVQPSPDKGKGDLYNPNECWRCGGMGHFARECTQDINPTKAIGKLHHTLEAETPIAKSLLTEFFNKLMRVQRKHDIVQAKLKKARQTGTGGTPAGAQGGTPGGSGNQGNPPPAPPSLRGQLANRRGHGEYSLGGPCGSKIQIQRISQGELLEKGEFTSHSPQQPERTLLARWQMKKIPKKQTMTPKT